MIMRTNNVPTHVCVRHRMSLLKAHLFLLSYHVLKSATAVKKLHTCENDIGFTVYWSALLQCGFLEKEKHVAVTQNRHDVLFPPSLPVYIQQHTFDLVFSFYRQKKNEQPLLLRTTP